MPVTALRARSPRLVATALAARITVLRYSWNRVFVAGSDHGPDDHGVETLPALSAAGVDVASAGADVDFAGPTASLFPAELRDYVHRGRGLGSWRTDTQSGRGGLAGPGRPGDYSLGAG